MASKKIDINTVAVGDVLDAGPLFKAMDPDISIKLRLVESVVGAQTFEATYLGVKLGEVDRYKDEEGIEWEAKWA